MKKIVLFVLFFGNFMYLMSQQSSDSYQIKFLEINEVNSDYAVAMLDDNKLVFTSASSTNRKNHNPRKELFIGDIDFDGEILNIQPVTNKENNKYNTTGIAYTKDLKTVYFSRNKYIRKSKKQELPKNKRLDLFKASVDKDGNWSNIQRLSFNNEKYSTGYPTLNKDNTKLFFVSDRLPSAGKTDIFVVDINNDGTYGKPRNLGKMINTSGEETTPFITSKNTLYFASDGHQGNGNLDIYAADIINDNISEIRHLNSPVNSINDDFAYIINDESDRGFFTSNRLQGDNNIDLYSFSKKREKPVEDCYITVEGFVKDKESQELLKGTTVDLLDINDALIESVLTSDDGTYKFNVKCSNEYKLSASNTEYKKEVKQIEILDQNYHRSLNTNLNLTRLYDEVVETKARVKVKENNVDVISINAIYFDFDKANLRKSDLPELDKIVRIMKDNTDIKVEAAAYTDSRGNHNYNKLLSQRRANATVKYIISKGIDASRIKGKGYGEEKLINQCVDNIECSEEAHQKNRRTEFIILNKHVVNDQSKYKKDKSKLVINTKSADNNVSKKDKTLTVSNTKKSIIISNNPDKITNAQNTFSLNQEIVNSDFVNISSAKSNKNKEEQIVTTNKILEPLNKDEKSISISDRSDEITNDLARSQKMELNNMDIAETDQNEFLENKRQVKKKETKIIARTDNKAENYIDDQKEKVIEKLIVLEEKFDEASASNPDFKDSFLSQKNKINKFKKEVINDNTAGWANIINYNNKIISFNKTYSQLMQNVEKSKQKVSNDNTEESIETKYLDKESTEGKSAVNTKNDLLKIEEINSLDVKNIQVVAMKKNDKGNYAVTNSAKKTDMIKVSFRLLHNENVKSGQKEAHFILENPKGKVTNAKGVFTSKITNEMRKFTDFTVIDYHQNDVDVIMFVDRKGHKYEKGIYPVKLFLEGELVAESNLNLTNSGL